MRYSVVESVKPNVTEVRPLSELKVEGGFSETLRSHAPVVTLETITSSDWKKASSSLLICYGIHATRFGELLIATTPNGICNVHFLNEGEDTEHLLRSKWKNAELVKDFSMTQAICDRVFSSTKEGGQEPISLWVKGTDFQRQVWRALLTIPFGQVTTYQAIANMIGKPTAARAVGNAIGQNPIAYLIPCHRVVRGSGALGGYFWGLDRKIALLEWEAIAKDSLTNSLDNE